MYVYAGECVSVRERESTGNESGVPKDPTASHAQSEFAPPPQSRTDTPPRPTRANALLTCPTPGKNYIPNQKIIIHIAILTITNYTSKNNEHTFTAHPQKNDPYTYKKLTICIKRKNPHKLIQRMQAYFQHV